MGGRKTIGVIHGEAFGFLKANYRTLWLVSLVLYGVEAALGIVMSVFTAPLQLFSGFLAPLFASLTSDLSIGNMLAVTGAAAGVMAILGLAACVIGIAVGILESACFIGGYNATLISMAGDRPTFDGVWKDFGRNWKRYVGVTAWALLWTFLWSLLFIVPGIVKMYSYRLAPYLVLQYPDMTVRQALKKSMEMTSGYKGRLFGLDIILFLYGIASVVGVCLLFVGTLAIQILWLTPMTLLMYSVVYLDIKKAAIERGMLPPDPVPPADGAAMTAEQAS